MIVKTKWKCEVRKLRSAAETVGGLKMSSWKDFCLTPFRSKTKP